MGCRLKTDGMRKLLEMVTTLSIVAIPTWETQHVRYSDERSTLMQIFLRETMLSALVEQYYIDKGVFIEVIEAENHNLYTPSNDLWIECTGSSSAAPRPKHL